jgi:hypothetical protein
MRWPIVFVFLLPIVFADHAAAQNFPWCALYPDPVGTNCGFTSFAQCLATVSGAGGFCEPNTLYRSPRAAPPALKARARRHA